MNREEAVMSSAFPFSFPFSSLVHRRVGFGFDGRLDAGHGRPGFTHGQCAGGSAQLGFKPTGVRGRLYFSSEAIAVMFYSLPVINLNN